MGTVWYFHQNRRDLILNNRYQGEFRRGLRHGLGNFYYADGSLYCGEWANNLKDGFGLYTAADGSVLTALFVQDRINTKIELVLCGDQSLLVGKPAEEDVLNNSSTKSLRYVEGDEIDGDKDQVKTEKKKETVELEPNVYHQLMDFNDLLGLVEHSDLPAIRVKVQPVHR